MTEIVISRSQDKMLRGLAILGVFFIHLFSSFKSSPYVFQANYQWLVVALDQFFRLGVPLFVALSGYGLAQKYSKKDLVFGVFLGERLKKLLPSYVLWSAVFVLLFWFVPGWASSQSQPSFFWKLVLGRSDYHLYFVPMIVQLYVFFPVIFFLFKKMPIATVFVAFLIQAWWYWRFIYQGEVVLLPIFSLNDKEQYVWAANWVGYFALGMYLPRIWKLFSKNSLLAKIFCGGVLISLMFVIIQAVRDINLGMDPLNALRFTRYFLIVYCSGAIVASGWLVRYVKTPPRFLLFLGEHSYLIYLSHTLLLRLAFSI